MGSSDTGSESEDDARASTLGPDDYSRNPFTGGMSLNASGRAKMGYDSPGGDGGGDDNNQPSGPSPQQIAIQNAKSARSNALKKKQKELKDAFGFFNDDFYSDMSDSYKDFAQGSLDTAYDDSLRGIYAGFKAKGLLSQANVDEAMAGLNAAKAEEMKRLDTLASEYANTKRAEVEKGRTKYGDELSALVGGATDEASINKQRDAIENFDIEGRVNKLKKPGAKAAVDFFKGYDKVKAQAQPNVGATAGPEETGDEGGSASSVVQMGANTAPSSMVGIRSPFQGSSTKVLG